VDRDGQRNGTRLRGQAPLFRDFAQHVVYFHRVSRERGGAYSCLTVRGDVPQFKAGVEHESPLPAPRFEESQGVRGIGILRFRFRRRFVGGGILLRFRLRFRISARALASLHRRRGSLARAFARLWRHGVCRHENVRSGNRVGTHTCADETATGHRLEGGGFHLSAVLLFGEGDFD
jgi:hypothetical protein